MYDVEHFVYRVYMRVEQMLWGRLSWENGRKITSSLTNDIRYVYIEYVGTPNMEREVNWW